MDIEKIKALFNTYFVDVLKNHYTDFNGRANRPQYWYFVLFVFIISLVLGIIDSILFGRQILGLIFSLAILVPSIGLAFAVFMTWVVPVGGILAFLFPS